MSGQQSESRSPDRRRSPLGLRSLLVILALFWLAAPGNPAWLFLLLALGFLAYAIHTRDGLPDRVATHFAFNRQADGWMGRRTYLIFFSLFATCMSVAGPGFYRMVGGAQADFSPGT